AHATKVTAVALGLGLAGFWRLRWRYLSVRLGGRRLARGLRRLALALDFRRPCNRKRALELGDFLLQTRELGIGRRALLRYRAAGPAYRLAAAQRDLTEARVEAQNALVDLVEDIALILLVLRRSGRRRRDRDKSQTN